MKTGLIRFVKTLGMLVILLGWAGVCPAQENLREQHHEKLGFLVGSWKTTHTLDRPDGQKTVLRGEAAIDWVVGGSWLRHEFHLDVPGRGPAFVSLMMNYTPPRDMYNLYMFDHFGGEAGVFYGDWNDAGEIALTAEFSDDDGGTSYQRLVFKPVSADEFEFRREFSDDGEHYHFAARGVYTRR